MAFPAMSKSQPAVWAAGFLQLLDILGVVRQVLLFVQLHHLQRSGGGDEQGGSEGLGYPGYPPSAKKNHGQSMSILYIICDTSRFSDLSATFRTYTERLKILKY